MYMYMYIYIYIYIYIKNILFLKGSPPLFTRVAHTCKKETFFIYADDTDSINDDTK